jgi:hypothetical protein
MTVALFRPSHSTAVLSFSFLNRLHSCRFHRFICFYRLNGFTSIVSLEIWRFRRLHSNPRRKDFLPEESAFLLALLP